MKKLLLGLLLLLPAVYVFAGHIAGGEVYYRYVGPGVRANSSIYTITLRLFRECNPPLQQGSQVAALPSDVLLNIYNNTTPSTQYGGQQAVGLTGGMNVLNMIPTDPCITNAQPVCYQVGQYAFTIELPNTQEGYTVAFQTCCRTNLIANVEAFPIPGSPNVGEGATYTCNIPGTSILGIGANSSPVFALKDTTLVCQASPFKLDFSATDPDAGDSLSYAFCSAYDRGLTTNSGSTLYSSPPYNPVTYSGGFSGTQPLGPNVTINPVTGLISGRAPAAGRYVVNVCITEWRKGVPISEHRKDFTLIVTACQLTAAELKPAYINCDDFTMSFENESTAAAATYLWDFGEPSAPVPTSTNPTPTHTYQAAGTYTVKLKVTSQGGCADSTTAVVNIYPGFTPDFNITGSCFLNAYQFKDATVALYGAVNSWKWDFGDNTTIRDTASSKDSAWKYPAPVNTQVRLIVTSNRGCIDTIIKPLNVLDRPVIDLPFKDTLICSIDTLALRVNIASTATAQWTVSGTPVNMARILNAGTANPLVYPLDTTRYLVTVNDNGCVNTDVVTVNVLDFITVQLSDTTICLTDSIMLKPTSHALSYRWTPVYALSDPLVKNPYARPLQNTVYHVDANLGKCQANASARVSVVPYPVVNILNSDTSVCFGQRVQLRATHNATTFQWTPAASLANANTLTPTAGPVRTTQYIFTARNNISGCPKPVSDTITVIVIPPPVAFAGNDTVAVAGQPLQLRATGSGTIFSWNPPLWLNNPAISNPVANIPATVDSIRYRVRVSTIEGCYADDDLVVKLFSTGPEIFVPSAFTPNGDGRNDVLKPIPVGISRLVYFKVFNRWGQLIYSTTEIGKAWDGTFSGVKQPSGTYVYEVAGIDYRGNQLYRKGTAVLIR